MLSYIFTATLLAASAVNGHMTLSTPVPYGLSDLNNSPLAADGSDFPCKQRGANTYNGNGVDNEWPIGSTQILSFKGSAVHGGGSCQVSLTTDKNPTKDSKFFVIHSIVGGCPSNKTNDGNLPTNPDGSDSNKYTFTVPDGLASGEYTMAWTWFNRIGNREMYMNCAPVTITGGSKKRAIEARKASARSLLKRANFPDMFVANIGNGCGTSEGVDVEFPNAGDSVERDAADGKYGPPTGTCASGSGSGTSGSGSSSAAPPPASASTPAASQPAPSSTVVPEPSSTSTASLETTSASTPAPPPPPQSSTSASPSGSSGSNSGSTGALTGACDTGMWNCFNEGMSFQQCGSGIWSVAMATAAGNPCKVGTGATAPW